MACYPITAGPMRGGFICMRGRRPGPRCIVCGLPATRLCDARTPRGTCSAAVCDRHTRRQGEHDLCPRHVDAGAVIVPPAGAAPAAVQLDLFAGTR